MANSMFPRPTANDMVLLLTLMYSALDIQSEWAAFSTCRRPVHEWLLASYALLIIFRLLHCIGTHSANIQGDGSAGEFLINLRMKGALPQLMLYITWLIVMPGFSIWTVAGSLWTWQVWRHTPQCLPPQFLWFSVLWQVVSYFWIVAHVTIGCVAIARERKIQLAEADLRALEDPDTLERWGTVSQSHSLSVSAPHGSRRRLSKPGLTVSEIHALGGVYSQALLNSPGVTVDECPICLGELRTGDMLRRLPDCAHTFHRSCIDLWLLQSASCPLCKVEIPRKGSQANAMKECSVHVSSTSV